MSAALDMGARLDAEALFAAIERHGQWAVVAPSVAREVTELATGRMAPATLFQPLKAFEAVVVALEQPDGTAVLAGAQGRGPYAIVPELTGHLFLPFLYRFERGRFVRLAGFATVDGAFLGARALHAAPYLFAERDVTGAAGGSRTFLLADEKVVERILINSGFEPGRLAGSVSRVYRLRRG